MENVSNKKVERYKRYLKDKKVAVIGIGISNTPLIRYLADLGVNVTAFDRNEKKKLEPVLKKLKEFDIKYSLGSGYLEKLKGFDIVFKTPGMRYDVPELLRAKQEGSEITSEMEVFFELCPARIFAVSGSDGKTTTTTLIYNMLKEEGYKCWLGGNIGVPLLSSIDEIDSHDMVVLELSSFQLHTMKNSPNTAVITNVEPNHLDVHKSMEEYTEAKKNIFKYQKDDDTLVLNYDNSITRNFAEERKGKVVFFSKTNSIREGMVLKNGKIVYKSNGMETEVVKSNEIILPGAHNRENYLAAAAGVIEYVNIDTIYKVATTFEGVEHRMEFVREHEGVRYYNDAIGTSPTRTMACLNSFSQKVILIAGGKDKKLDYGKLGHLIVKRVKCLILLGQTAVKIENAVLQAANSTGEGRNLPVIKCKNLSEAVHTAYSKALDKDIVVMSPAGSSFDMFKNFEEKGNLFKKLVNEL